jgi:flavin-dependent dehydrogenase
MSDDVVDVLIIGAGASGAAVAWSLAETRMRVVCAPGSPFPQANTLVAGDLSLLDPVIRNSDQHRYRPVGYATGSQPRRSP